MPQQIGSRPMTGAERKARQRERDRADGFVELLVKIHKSRVVDLRKAELEMRLPMPHPNQESPHG